VESRKWDGRDCATCTRCATCTDCPTCAASTICATCATDIFRQKQLECLQAVDAIVQKLGEVEGSHRWKLEAVPLRGVHARAASRTRPGARADGAHRDRARATFDYAELIAELTGALPDPGVEGRSLKRLLCGVESTWRTDILNEHWNGHRRDGAL
jgi:hypothetical protein